MDKIQLFNEVVKVAKPSGLTRPMATSLDQELVDLGLDSLDTMMLTIYLADIYGVSEEQLKELRPKEIENPDGTKVRSMTLSFVFDFMEARKTAEPVTIEEAVAKIK